MHPKKHPFIFGSIVLLIGVLVALVVVTISQRGVLVVVSNSGSETMTGVQVALGGKQVKLGNIRAGDSASGRIVPAADSDVAITFTDSVGTSQTVRVDTYVTGGLKGRVDAEVKDGQLKGSKTNLRVSIL